MAAGPSDRKRKLTPEQKRGRKLRKQARINRGVQDAAPVLIPLLELFGTVDDVFTTEEAFGSDNIHKSLGRIYREWKEVRGKLDPAFNPDDYPKKPRRKKAVGGVRKGLHVSDSPTPSTARTSISGKSQKTSGKPEKRSAKASAERARSSGRASGGRS